MPRVDPSTIEIPHWDPRIVTLPEDLAEEATAVGQARYMLAVQRGQKDSFDENSPEAHIMGARGEAAFCWAYGIRWDRTYDTFGSVPDQLPDWEIRTTKSTEHLKVRRKKAPNNDDPTRRVTYVLERKDGTHFVLCRYIRAGEAQKLFPLTDPGNRKRPAHFVPLEALSRIDDIVHTIHAWTLDGPGYRCIFGGERS